MPEDLRPRAFEPEFAHLLERDTEFHRILHLLNADQFDSAVRVYRRTYHVGGRMSSEAVMRLLDGDTLSTGHVRSRPRLGLLWTHWRVVVTVVVIAAALLAGPVLRGCANVATSVREIIDAVSPVEAVPERRSAP